MRIETNKWIVTGASKLGHDHLFKKDNCQDAFALYADDNVQFGIVCDGCGSGTHSEVGSNLLAAYAKSIVLRYGDMSNARQYAKMIYHEMLVYINRVISEFSLHDEDLAQHVNDFWLFTVLGFISVGGETIIFNAGDGCYVVNDDMKIIDHNNAPKYMAYNLVPETFLTDKKVIASSFDMSLYLNDQIDRLMISTDGFMQHKFDRVTQYCVDNNLTVPSDPNGLHLNGLQWGKAGQTGLKRWMNAMSDRGYFADDCAIVTLERKTG